MKREYEDVIESCGWDISESDDCIEFYQYSPAGEDYGFAIDGNDLVKEIVLYAAGFDEDEHTEMWIEARRNGVAGVPSPAEIVDDARAIKAMLMTLATELLTVEIELKRKEAGYA